MAQDLGEGIDLDDTDGEDDAEVDDDSEEERKVAEGFLEDAKYAGEVDPDLLRRAHMEITDRDEKRMTEKILDVVRGESRRRKAARENDEWIPNRGARERLQNAHGGSRDAADRPEGEENEEALEGEDEEEEARIAAVLANQRLERLRFIQQAKELQKQEESGDEGEAAALQPVRAAPLVRKVSCAVPSLAEFGSKFAGGGLVRSVSGCPAAGGGPSAMRGQLKRGSSLLGSMAAKPADPGAAHQQPASLATGKVFFFDTRQRSSADAAPEGANSPEPASLAAQETPMVSARRSCPALALAFAWLTSLCVLAVFRGVFAHRVGAPSHVYSLGESVRPSLAAFHGLFVDPSRGTWSACVRVRARAAVPNSVCIVSGVCVRAWCVRASVF